jgi:SH3-like domain-containing protein
MEKIFIYITALLFLFSPQFLPGQPINTNYRVAEMETAVCVWDAVGLRAEPGKNGRTLEIIYFGEEVFLMGEESYIPDEKRTYTQIRLKNGKLGWVHDYLLVKGASMVVVLEKARIYKSPDAATTVTDQVFEPGELVAMAHFQGDWVLLVGKKKAKSGWIKGVNKVSIKDNDLEIAALYTAAMKEEDLNKRAAKLRDLSNRPDFDKSPLAPMIRSEVPATVAQNTPPPKNPATALEDDFYRYDFDDGTGKPKTVDPTKPVTVTPFTTPPATLPPIFAGNIEKEKVTDLNTGKEYWRISESGSVEQIYNPDAEPAIYYAYHKTLPKGTKILLKLPDNPGYVELVVIGNLARESAAVVGLSPECVRIVFGRMDPGTARIQYFTQPK